MEEGEFSFIRYVLHLKRKDNRLESHLISFLTVMKFFCFSETSTITFFASILYIFYLQTIMKSLYNPTVIAYFFFFFYIY